MKPWPLFLLLILYFAKFCDSTQQPKAKQPTSNDAQSKGKAATFESSPKYHLPKEVAVIGAGMAGLAAARRLSADRSNFDVKVYEARRDRFGGRVWTDKLTNPKAKGPEVDLGATAFNTATKNNPLVELAEDLGLKIASANSFQLFVPWENRVISGADLDPIKVDTAKVLQLALNESRTSKVEVSMKEAIDAVIEGGKFSFSDSASVHMVRCLPSYILGDYSARYYQADQLDVGFEKILVDGMGELVDRLVSGGLSEAPLHLNLNKAARQIKLDKDKNKLVIRFKDGSQVEADAVIVAVPPTVIASGGLLFEPALPKDYLVAANELSMFYGNKLIVEFEKAFWPKDIGHFVRAVKADAERGHLQSWFNVYHVSDIPALSSFLIGKRAEAFEKLTDEEVKEAVLSVLSEMFGESLVQQGGKIVRLQRSAWVFDDSAKGAATYPRVGSMPALWDTFSEPLCPSVYFAGEHTSFAGHGTLHGAYTSGLRAADQLKQGLCEQRKRQEDELEAQRREGGVGGDQTEGETEEGDKEEL